MSSFPQYAGIRNSVLLGHFYLIDDSRSHPNRTYVISIDFNASLLNVRAALLETVRIGPYYAQNCKSNNNNFATLLNTLRDTLQPILTDLRSTTSSDAYNTFFKDIAHAPYVRKVFSNITKGVSVPPKPGTQPWVPNFICVDDQDQVIFSENHERVDAFTRCRDIGEAPSYALLTTPYIIICPVFFTQAALPVQSTASCLTVDSHRNRFVQDGKRLIKYQLWHILHELVHYYVYSTKEDFLDIYGINFCLALPGRNAVLNAQSYVYYAASKWMSLRLPLLLTEFGRHTIGMHELSNRESEAAWSRSGR